MRVSVVISTYNSPLWLEKVIWGYSNQTHVDFEIVIADDGSGPETKAVIDQLKKQTQISIQHVWQPDNGFQKSQVLNRAILASLSEYLIFSDGDCIPKPDFLQVHVDNAEKGYFLSGGYFKLPMIISQQIQNDDILAGRVFDVKWLTNSGLNKTYKSLKLTSGGNLEKLLNRFTPTKATWNGHNSSGWKQDIVGINGFDERMQYGGQDRELGERMINLGLKGKQIRYSAIVVHLDHKRGYNTQESIARNKQIRKTTRSQNITWTDYGIIKK
ncbi:MAG: glycosyltransferase family 2 protein [Bacteroidetes bacterium]|nr:glycosyltransferase family 2 protein [Bacteroidota bacterium]